MTLYFLVKYLHVLRVHASRWLSGCRVEGHYLASEATASPAALSPQSRAPCAVEKNPGEVASPAKNNRPSTGAASTARSAGMAR